MNARRILVVIAVLMGITTLSVAVTPAPRQNVQTPSSTSEGASGNAPASSESIERTIAAEDPQIQTVAVPIGSLLRLTVTSEALDGVEIEGLDRFLPVSPDLDAEFELLNDRAGSFDIRLVESGRVVGRLEVSSAR